MFEKKKKKIEYLILKGGYLRLLLKRFGLLILILSTIGGILGGIISYITYTPQYTVTQAFTIKLTEHPGANTATLSDNQLSKTIPSLLSSDTFVNYMKPYMKSSGVTGNFIVTSLEHSNIFYLTVVSDNNNSCIKIIDNIQSHYGELAEGVIGESEMKFMAPPAYSNLPTNAPNYTLGVVLGALSVLVISAVILILKARFTNTVTSSKDIENEINAPCLSTIHQIYHKRRSGESKEERRKISNVLSENTDLEFKQEISTLSTNLDKICKRKGFKSILVTSTVSGEGKSSVSLNLACDLADKGKRVIILDCDLRTPCIAENLDIDNASIQLSDAITTGDFSNVIVKTSINNLYFSGNLTSDPAAFENTASKGFKLLVEEMEKEFDYIILDSPPSGFLGDAIEIGEIVDGFIYVISHNCISKSYILRSLSSFDEAKCEMLGFVINHK